MAHRIMRDSTTAADIPLAGLDLVAGYVNGRYAWSDADWARFGTRPRVHIDVNGSDPHAAGVLDVERGDATAAQAPVWVKQRKALGAGATGCTIYCDRSTLASVQQALHSADLLPGRDYTLWLATLDGNRAVADALGKELGVVAVQWEGQAQTGGHYDQSIVYDDAWHPAPVAPKPTWQAQALAQARAVVAALEAHQ
jgi:hypothetical protein